MAPRKIIIDTDPGVDDILAMLLAFSALPEELEVLLISVTYGNIDVQNALRNTVALFSIVEKEIQWRKSQPGRKVGFESLLKTKPLVAVGPERPLADQMLMADFFHGRDGLGDISNTHPHLSPADTWKQLFTAAEASSDPAEAQIADEMMKTDALFTPSKQPGSKEILRLLRENEPDTITIVAVGPMTNVAIAAAEDPETFLRVKEVVVMGGTIHYHGNITPNAEFNTFADAVAAARVYALSSPKPTTTMPPTAPAPPGMIQSTHAPPPPFLPDYPASLSRRLRVTLFPLDITEQHVITRGEFYSILATPSEQKSPLAEWVAAFMGSTFAKVESLQAGVSGETVSLQLHDPLCIWYCMAGQTPDAEQWRMSRAEDIRVETSGQWTRGMCVVDRRSRKPRDGEGDDGEGEIVGDHGNWLHGSSGNRLDRCVGSPGKDIFGRVMLERIFAL